MFFVSPIDNGLHENGTSTGNIRLKVSDVGKILMGKCYISVTNFFANFICSDETINFGISFDDFDRRHGPDYILV